MRGRIAAYADVLSRFGLRRTLCRAARLFRYRLIYPGFIERPFIAGSKELDAGAISHGQWSDCLAISRSIRVEDAIEPTIRSADEMCERTFQFLNLPPVVFDETHLWKAIHIEDPLWQYTFHYGEWALDLARAYRMTGEVRYVQSLKAMAKDWMTANPPGTRPGWDPYPLSRRIVAWTNIGLDLIDIPGWEPFWRQHLGPSIWQQAAVLRENLERDLENNHLIANYKALAWVGLLFPNWPEAQHWKRFGLNRFWKEIHRQVLPDGGHNERSISYHAIVMHDLDDIAMLCECAETPAPEDIKRILNRMNHFLRGMQAPDGSYPMLNDSVPGYPCDWSRLTIGKNDSDQSIQETAVPRTLSLFPDTGYAVIRRNNDQYLYFDIGHMGPAHLPGHGHADALSVNLFAGGKWRIVDPGVYTYHDSRWRNYFRGTRVHNTITVDDQDQCLFMGGFKVAFPPEVRLLNASPDEICGEHNGYARLDQAVVHRRLVKKHPDRGWIIQDTFSGSGIHEFLFTLQFSADAKVRAESRQNISFEWPDKYRIDIRLFSLPVSAVYLVEDGWVSPGWHKKLMAPRFVLRWRSTVPCSIVVGLDT